MLKGKTAVVTGGSRGIGEAIVYKFASLGANVAVIYAGNAAAAEKICKKCMQEYGVEAKAYQCNVADFSASKETVAKIKSDFRAVQFLINNAGITRDGLLAVMKKEDFDAVMDINLKGAFNMIRHMTGLFLREREGCIINITLPATHMLTVSDFVYRIKTSKVKAIICTTQNDVPEKITSAIKEAETTAKLWCVGQETEGFENLTNAMKDASEDFKRVQTLVTDPMMLYFTSGTTGYPKGVIHDHSYPLAHIVTAKYWHQAEDNGLHFTVAETGWAKASWGKIYGQWLIGSAVMVYDFDNFEPKQLTAVINRYGVTSFCAPPTVYRYLVRKGIPDMPTLKHATTAGEMLAPEVFRKFEERTGLQLCEGYGQTETTLLMANFKGCDIVEGAMGIPSPLYNIELRGKNGEPVDVGDVGEVVIVPKKGCKPLGVFNAYLDNEEQYEYVWRDGVYHTGDAAYMDENGRYWFHGRFDDIIKTGGFRVGPCEVENVLMEHPAVAECSVIGVPDSLRGQAIKAVIVLDTEYTSSQELALEIKNFCNQKLAEYKWIRMIEFVTEMPKTISGKIQKTVLRS